MNMAYMFLSASAFSQDLGGWGVGNVSNMFSMFRFAAQFKLRRGAIAWTLPKPVWGTCPEP